MQCNWTDSRTVHRRSQNGAAKVIEPRGQRSARLFSFRPGGSSVERKRLRRGEFWVWGDPAGGDGALTGPDLRLTVGRLCLTETVEVEDGVAD